MPVKYIKSGRNAASPQNNRSKSRSKSRSNSKSRAPKLHNMRGGGFLNNAVDSIGASKGHPGFTEPKKLSCTNNQMEFGSSCITWFTIVVFMVLGALLFITLWAVFGNSIKSYCNISELFSSTESQPATVSPLIAGNPPTVLDMHAPGYLSLTQNNYNRIADPSVVNLNNISIRERIVSKDYERAVNPLLPPERSYEETYGVPINIPSRGFAGGFQQVGMLYKDEIADPDKKIGNNSESVILPLYGRPLYNGSKRWTYYTTNDKMAMVKLKLESKGRKCDSDQGCEEIYEGDTISVPPYNGVFKVNIYDYDKPHYIPVAY